MVKNKVVFDTNIWISAVLFGGNPKKAIDLAQQKCQIFCSMAILQELKEVLTEDFNLPYEKLEELIEVILELVQMVPLGGSLQNISSDLDDNLIIETALMAGAGYLVTGDKHLLVLKQFKNIEILTVNQFLEFNIHSC
ncbi:MAG: putative toxin-antitoxin system toxin component, PIN family [Patescibacteria group bacterium]|nr:putative toxin-antitoxin system toxin component, PIN family [Patescibacteria group bacterium]